MAFYFGSDWRPIPLEQTFIGVLEKEISKQKKLLNEVCYDKVAEAVKNGHQVMVFVHARGDTLSTADFLIRQAQFKKQLSLFTERVRGLETVRNSGCRFCRYERVCFCSF